MTSKLSYRDDPDPAPKCDVVSYELEVAVYIEAGQHNGREGFFAESNNWFSDTLFFRPSLGEALEALLSAAQPDFPRARFRVHLVTDRSML